MLAYLRNTLALTFALVAALAFSLTVHAQTPPATGIITDQAAVLSPQDKQRLTHSLTSYERETTHQIAVLTVSSLAGEPIETFSLRVAKAWGVGQKGANNGILVVLAPQERKVRIELGLGFERYITNDRAGEIIRTQMTPAFREGRYAEGLERGLAELMIEGRKFLVPR